MSSFISLLLVIIFTIDSSSQSIYLNCLTDETSAICSTANYIQKANSEIILTPNVARDKIEVVYVHADSEEAEEQRNNLTTFPNELIVEFSKVKCVSINLYMINSIVFDDAMW
jgi:hypothetical protein